MSRQMIACDEASYLVSYRQENRLTIRQWWKLQVHLLSCYLCRRYASQVEGLQKAMDQYRECTLHGSCEHHLDEGAAGHMQQMIAREMDTR